MLNLSKKEYELIKKECKPTIINYIYLVDVNDKKSQGYIVTFDKPSNYYKANRILERFYNEN